MHWILQSNLFNESAYQVLLDTLIKFNLPYSIHKVVPFVGELLPEPELDTKNVMCMGSYSLRHAAKRYGWTPGVFDLEPMDFTVQKEKWGERMLNYNAVVSPFKDAVFPDPVMFVRPTEDSKIFSGKLFDKEDFEHWQKQVCELNLNFHNALTSDTLIQICPPIHIYSEHRFWVVKGEIVTSSTYKLGRSVVYQPVIGTQFELYVKECIAEWQPHEAFVIDVADTEKGIKIVEINTLNSSGFYAADMQKLVMALEDAFDTKPPTFV